MIERIESILTHKYNPIIFLTIISTLFHLIETDFDLKKSIIKVLTVFLFATFISFMITTIKKVHNTNESFFNWWWKIYGLMIIGGILSWITFG